MRRARTQGPLRHPGRSLKGRPAPDGIETFFEVKTRDSELPPEEFAKLTRRPIHIVLDNLRSAFNVGSIFRLADAARAAEVITCGYTAYPPHHKLEQTSLGTTDSVPWRRFDDTLAALADLRARGIQIVGVETAKGAPPYHRFDYSFPVALVLGNEALGVSEAALRACDAVIEIPVFGYKNSVNVATAAAIVLYEALRRGDWLDGSESPGPLSRAIPPDGIWESGT
ncbi:MAG TPA: RNA methyltransferase [bacterium]|nr:RNA methyltransferase [bacterium]